MKTELDLECRVVLSGCRCRQDVKAVQLLAEQSFIEYFCVLSKWESQCVAARRVRSVLLRVEE
jgi:hypothetical protein